MASQDTSKAVGTSWVRDSDELDASERSSECVSAIQNWSEFEFFLWRMINETVQFISAFPN